MLSILMTLAAAATAAPSSTAPLPLPSEIQVCAADLRAAIDGDPEFLARFSANAGLTVDQGAHLTQTCAIFESGAATIVQILREPAPEPASPLIPGNGVAI